MPGKVRGGSVTRSGTPCSRSRVVGVLKKKGQRHAVQDVQEEGLAFSWSACPGARISLISSSTSSGKGCDPSPNESDS